MSLAVKLLENSSIFQNYLCSVCSMLWHCCGWVIRQ